MEKSWHTYTYGVKEQHMWEYLTAFGPLLTSASPMSTFFVVQGRVSLPQP